MCAKEFEEKSPKVASSCKNNCQLCGTFRKSLLKTVCGHLFCRICIKDWIQYNDSNCPKCKFQFQTLEKYNICTDFMVSQSIVFRRFNETPISDSRDEYKTYSQNIKVVDLNWKSATNGTAFKSCDVCGFFIKNDFHNCFELLKRNPQKLKLTFNRLKTEKFNLKESTDQKEDESTPQWKAGYEDSIKSLNQTNTQLCEKQRQNGLTIKKLNDKIFHYKGMVRQMIRSKDHWKWVSYRQRAVIRHMKTKNMAVKHSFNKQKRKHFKELSKFCKKFKSIERQVNEVVYKLFDENFDLKEELQTLRDHICQPIIICQPITTLQNEQQFNEDNQQISKLIELQVKCEELEQKLNPETQLIITNNEKPGPDLDLDIQEIQLGEHATVNPIVQSIPVKRGTKRRLQIKEKNSRNKQIIGSIGCKPKYRNMKIKVQLGFQSIHYKNEELSKEICLRDEFIKRLTDRIEIQTSIKLNTKYVLVGTHLLIDYKIAMFKKYTNYDSEQDDRSFHVMHSSIEELMFCLDNSHQLMITKIDATVCEYIRQRIQLEEYNPNNEWFDSQSEDPSETYIIVHFPDNSTEIWVRMALILLLFDYKPKFITEREAQFILNRAYPSRAIHP